METKTKTKIYIPDIECDSCTKLLKSRLKDTDGIKDYAVEPDGIEFYPSDGFNTSRLIQSIQEMGFRAALNPFERKTFPERWRDFRQNPHKYNYVYKALSYALWSFVILIAIEVLAYFGFLHIIPQFLPKFAWWIFYLDISISTIGASIWYMYSQKGHVTCMTGMMIGMTVGMQIGMMIGAVIGAVNGFFIGAMVGMIGGTIIGLTAGSVCGMMGLMQGMMAGVMGGTMGAMITVMMFFDHVLIFMPFYILFNIAILAGFIYMYYEEVIENKRDIEKRHMDFATFASICIIVAIALGALMIYGPKSALFGPVI